jgi:hypothetical protein
VLPMVEAVCCLAVLRFSTQLLELAQHSRNIHTLELQYYQINGGRITASLRYDIIISPSAILTTRMQAKLRNNKQQGTHLQIFRSGRKILWNRYVVTWNFSLPAKTEIVLYRVRRPKVNDYKSCNNLLMKMKLGRLRTLVDVKITGLRRKLKLVSLRLETQADMTLHVGESCSHRGRRDDVESKNEGKGANRVGRDRISVAKYTLLSSFVCIGKSLRMTHPVHSSFIILILLRMNSR